MSQTTVPYKPLFLTEDEASALLDLCLMSRTELDTNQECAMIKLTGLVRQFLAAEIASDSGHETALRVAPVETRGTAQEAARERTHRGIPVLMHLHVLRGMNPMRHACRY